MNNLCYLFKERKLFYFDICCHLLQHDENESIYMIPDFILTEKPKSLVQRLQE